MATISASRRPIRDDVERSTEPNCRMAQLPSAPANKGFLKKWRRPQIDAVRTPCRGWSENSNAATDRWLIHNRFIAAFGFEAVEIFYPKIPPARREAPVRTR
jgi:hypothetical protein